MGGATGVPVAFATTNPRLRLDNVNRAVPA